MNLYNEMQRCIGTLVCKDTIQADPYRELVGQPLFKCKMVSDDPFSDHQ